MVDWDGTPSEYLTLESGLNILIPLPGRWSGGYCLCILLITGYRFQTDNVCAFRDGQRRSGSWGVIDFLQGSYSNSAASTIEYSESTIRGWFHAKVFGTLRSSPLSQRSLPICPTTSGWPTFSTVACPHPSCLPISCWQFVRC